MCPLRGPWSQRRDARAARRAHGRGEHRPPSTGRSLLTGAPGPPPGAAALRLPPRSCHAALRAAGLLGPYESRCGHSPFLQPRSLSSPGGRPSPDARSTEARKTKRPAVAGGGKDPSPAPGARAQAAGRAPSALSASFFPAGSRRPRYRELPPRCPNTRAAAASPPLIGQHCP